MPTLNLPATTFEACWNLTKPQLTTYFDQKVRVEFYEGKGSLVDLASIRPPVVRFYPQLRSLTWHDESRLQGPLVVGVEALLDAVDPIDVMRLQLAIVAALYPADNGAFILSLTNAGAETGQWMVDNALNQPMQVAGRDRLWRLLGSMRLDVNTGVVPD